MSGGAAASPPAAALPAADWLDAVRWNEQGLVCAVAQEHGSGRVLMVAWMDRTALAETVRSGLATYWSRSRGRLWRKGEESGHRQEVQGLALDCDGDCLLLQVIQVGGIACHTGRHSCFHRALEDGRWVESEPVLQDPATFYQC